MLLCVASARRECSNAFVNLCRRITERISMFEFLKGDKIDIRQVKFDKLIHDFVTNNLFIYFLKRKNPLRYLQK